ncbi:U3 small nucleolar RNA-interacting protein 2 [Sarcoptes scabiei]|nr:U3 small nucleolar RNA-interacting protein 2 [Sarcoptes scabiei]
MNVSIESLAVNSNSNRTIQWNSLGSYIFSKMPSFLGRDRDRDRVFLKESSTGKTLTYRQFYEKVQSLANAMLSVVSLEKDDFFIIMSESSIQYALVIGVSLLLNVPYSSVLPACGPYNLGFQLDSIKPKVLFISQNLFPKAEKMFSNVKFSYLKDLVTVIVINDDELFCDNFKIVDYHLENLISNCQNSPPISSAPYFDRSLDDLFLIVYTSGSTGQPKGACHTHRTLLNNIIALRECKILKENCHHTMILTFPLGHISGNCIFFYAMTTQTKLILHNNANFQSLYNLISEESAVQLFGASSIINGLATNLSDFLPSLKLIWNSGNRLPKHVAEKFFEFSNAKVVDSYGSTECLYVTFKEFSRKDSSQKGATRLIPECQFRIIDPTTKRAVDIGRTGEILCKSPCVFKEYYKNYAETSKAFDEDGWFITGDVGFLDENGDLHITDRVKEIIKFECWSVFPADLECFLMSHPAVKGALVIGLKHPDHNQVPRAYVSLKSDHPEATVEHLHRYINENLGYQHQIRGGIVIVPDLRYTSMGKIDRKYYKDLSENEVISNQRNGQNGTNIN